MLSLGVECTAHTLGIGICNRRSILGSWKSVYVPKGGGIVPREAAENHLKNFAPLLKKALTESGLSLEEVDLFSFSRGPGLGHTLRVGAVGTRYLALKYGKPVIGVNHCVAHVEVGKLLTGARDPVVLYVSGGNTQILAWVGGRYRTFGETLDIGLGNALDVFARECGLPHPGGPKVEELAREGKYVKLPYTVKGMCFSFSGIVTEALRLYKKGVKLEDLCFSIQETLFAMVTEALERAVAHTGKEEVLLTGGVAANSRLKEMVKTMCEERGAVFHAVPTEYAGDNGAMIAWTGVLAHSSGAKYPETIDPLWRTDEVDTPWIKGGGERGRGDGC